MKILFLSLLSLMSLSLFSQPPKAKATTTQHKKTEKQNPAGLVFTDTLSQVSDTVKVKYYLDVDSAGYVSVNKGYLIRTATFSRKVAQLKSESSVLFDDRWKKVDPNLVMNFREFDW